MKSIITYLAGFSLLTLSTVSCSKDAHNEMRPPANATQAQIIKANVAAGETYVLNLSAGNTASIQTQARHYQLSEIATAENGSTVYKYSPLKGYNGADEVTLQQMILSTTLPSGGGCHNQMNSAMYSSAYTTTVPQTIVLKFNVAN